MIIAIHIDINDNDNNNDIMKLEYRIPGLRSPANSRRPPEMFGDLCNNRTIFL